MSGRMTLIQPRRFYTVARADCSRVEKWLDDRDFGVKPRQFYASFINWAHQTVRRYFNPATRDVTKEEERAVNVLSKFPVDTQEYLDLMEWYWETIFEHHDLKKGVIPVDKFFNNDIIINHNQSRLYEAVFTRAQRREHKQSTGTVDLAYFDQVSSRRSERKFNRRKAARAAALRSSADAEGEGTVGGEEGEEDEDDDDGNDDDNGDKEIEHNEEQTVTLRPKPKAIGQSLPVRPKP